MNDREKAGLRGLVQCCKLECEHTDADRHSTEDEFDLDGRLLVTRVIYPSSEWISTRTYDAGGRLTRISTGAPAHSQSETSYSYDELGRLCAITAVRIDEMLKQGACAEAMDLSWDAHRDEISAPLRGTVRVLYNEAGRPAELQHYDERDRLFSRLIRTYDVSGRVVEEDQIPENVGLLFAETLPPQEATKLDVKQVEALTRAMKTVMRGKKGAGVSYSYDHQGRLVEVRQRNFIWEVSTAIRYNEHGDKSEARATFEPNNAIPLGGGRVTEDGEIVPSQESVNSSPIPDLLVGSAYIYKYDCDGYDEHGNWTRQKRTTQIGPEIATIFYRRTLSYFPRNSR